MAHLETLHWISERETGAELFIGTLADCQMLQTELSNNGIEADIL